MENLNVYLLFTWTVLALAYSPGPNVVLMINNGLKYKLNNALFAVPGTAFALLFFAAVTVFCVGGVLKISPNFFMGLKIVGALYLFYLGIKSFMSKGNLKFSLTESIAERSKKALFSEAFLCCITNPKVLFIYVALIPQFITQDEKAFSQLITLCIIQIIVTCLSMLTYLLLARKASGFLQNKARYISIFSGLVMCFFAVTLLVSKVG
ncbi:LysE family translocator [Fluviispira vulneris]|uniref:LysE family translocator n=1 Tax=Fluviispira vulneris TaxID=2763012 RepID=UPI001648E534|nr:LysE family translocator [Fluviispira vulneris]